jgi:hypothetical protein
MKLATLASLCLMLCTLNCPAQAGGELRIADLGPFPIAAPGQIV